MSTSATPDRDRIGDGDPREYGGRLPDGRRWIHPPYGPTVVDDRPLPFLRGVSAPERPPWTVVILYLIVLAVGVGYGCVAGLDLVDGRLW